MCMTVCTVNGYYSPAVSACSLKWKHTIHTTIHFGISHIFCKSSYHLTCILKDVTAHDWQLLKEAQSCVEESTQTRWLCCYQKLTKDWSKMAVVWHKMETNSGKPNVNPASRFMVVVFFFFFHLCRLFCRQSSLIFTKIPMKRPKLCLCSKQQKLIYFWK